MFERFITRLAFILFGIIVFMAFTTTAKADTALIYHSNYSDAHTRVKSKLEADGYTVTLSTNGAIADNLYTKDIDGTSGGYDVVVDLKYNNNIGSNGRSRYDDFVKAGGVLIVTGENETNFSSRNNNIEALINSKFGGSLTMGNAGGYVNSLNSTYTDSSIDSGSNMMYIAGGASLSGDGEWVAKIGNTVVWMVWEGSDLPSGYDGAVYVTGDINQFTQSYMASTCSTNSTCTAINLIGDVVEYSVPSATPTYSSSISSAQTTQMNNARNITNNGNGIYITQSGNNNAINITQDGNDNLIAGGSTTTNSTVDATITGNNNTADMTQRGNNNVILFDITGDYNSTTLNQGGAAGADDNRILMDIDGDYNTVSNTQTHNDGVGNNGHFLALDIDGDNNNILTSQLNDGDKKAFISAQGDDNDIDLYQQGTGSHYVEIAVGSDQTADITQDGSGNHNASISMDGYSATIDLTQDSSTNQTYSLSQTCINANGCGTTTVVQN